MNLSEDKLFQLSHENQDFSLLIDKENNKYSLTMLKSDMSEKYESSLDLNNLYADCKVFGAYDTL